MTGPCGRSIGWRSFPPSGPLAPRLDPGSESGLRIAHEATSGEHASLGVILGAEKRMSSGRVGIESEARIAHANTEPAVFPLASDDMPIPASPRYGLLVTVVAAVCIIIPVALYVFLTSNKEEAVVPGVPAQPSSDVVKRDDTIRQKFVKPTKGKHR